LRKTLEKSLKTLLKPAKPKINLKNPQKLAQKSGC
jgi:hypothetical protein